MLIASDSIPQLIAKGDAHSDDQKSEINIDFSESCEEPAENSSTC